MGKGRILVVDDQPYFRDLGESLLIEAGYDARAAESGEDALRALERGSFDLVITDLVMPVMSGTDLVFRVKQDYPDQEILVVTSAVDVKSAVEALKVGATAYLLKPFDRVELCSAVDGIFEQKQLREDHERLLADNLEHLAERALLERALGLMEALSHEVLAEKILAGLCEESGAQSGVLWRDTNTNRGFQLASVRGLLRPEHELNLLTEEQLPVAMRDENAPTVLCEESGSELRHLLWVSVRLAGGAVAYARLSDKVGDERFDEVDASCAEKFARYSATAFRNVDRATRLERRSLQNPDTGAYRVEVLHDVVRTEIEKANRFGHRFGLLEVGVEPTAPLRERFGKAGFEEWHGRLARYLGRFLRSTDLLAALDDGRLCVVLAETDAVGATTFKQRLREALSRGEPLAGLPASLRPELSMGIATYPGDGTQLESLLRTLSERRLRDRRWRASEERLAGLSLCSAFSEMLDEAGEEESPEDAAALLRFLVAERGRRPRERNLLFVRPGAGFAAALAQGLAQRTDPWAPGELIVVGEPARLEPADDGVVWMPADALEPGPAFAVQFGDGPPYVWTAEGKGGGEGLRLFHSTDRALAESLCFRLLTELGVAVNDGLGT